LSPKVSIYHFVVIHLFFMIWNWTYSIRKNCLYFVVL
jgi:hypothetical protein